MRNHTAGAAPGRIKPGLAEADLACRNKGLGAAWNVDGQNVVLFLDE